MQKKAKKAEKREKSKKSEKIYLNLASLCFASKRKSLKCSEAKISEKRKVKFYSEIVKHM